MFNDAANAMASENREGHPSSGYISCPSAFVISQYDFMNTFNGIMIHNCSAGTNDIMNAFTFLVFTVTSNYFMAHSWWCFNFNANLANVHADVNSDPRGFGV